MGIPKFFRWLTRRYPLILQNIFSEEDCPPTDNLYLDLNSIVHNVIHGNDKSKLQKMNLKDMEEVWANIMRAIDEIVHTVKPRKMIMLALDGVAPRAKMNQQRERRFRAAQESQQIAEQLASQGKEVIDVFDTNQISPGTEFMFELGKQLEWFVKYKLNTDPLYQNCQQVILSDTSVPGEGEHKMLDYIRNSKLNPDYDPNTRHCFYGSDADLIMLSLLTHEPHFYIIREEHVINKKKQGGIQRIDIERTKNLQLIHISILREYFLLEYREHADKMKIPFSIERIIDDFVFFCFFIGNDFLPHCAALDISEGSLDHLINFYKKCLPEFKDYITDRGLIHWDRAESFIQLLGKYEHQVFINKVKVIDQKYHDSKNIMTFGEMEQKAQLSQQDKTRLIQENLAQKIHQNKVDKCKKHYEDHTQKSFKKKLLKKQFAELDEDEEAYVSLTKKFKDLRQTQDQKKNQQIQQYDGESLVDLLQGLDEGYLSDLKPTDIPNDQVESVSDTEAQEGIEEKELAAGLSTQMKLMKHQSDNLMDQNFNFMKDFVETYQNDAPQAKRNYYQAKLKFDVNQPQGKTDLKKLLYRYLEGLQWVLFYYYRGSQHWRWYYPYHYAPMLSDLGTNIVQTFLNGKTTIEEFKVDVNCNENPAPYTPFQQLLCIMPIRSMKKVLPAPYVGLAEGVLNKYFPDNFEIDLNGKTLPWEAVILIPFVDEEEALSAEESIIGSSLVLSEREQKRNLTSFDYPFFIYDRRHKNPTVLKPIWKNFKKEYQDKTIRQISTEYGNCGKSCFSSTLLKGVKSPMPDFPSLHWLQVNEIVFKEIFVNKVPFKMALCRIPKCKEDLNGTNFENTIFEFTKQKSPEIYVNFPRQIEAFPITFEDPFGIYMVQWTQEGKLGIQKFNQVKPEEEFRHHVKVLCAGLEQKGFLVNPDEVNTLVSFNFLQSLEYDEDQDYVYKLYSETAQSLPLSMMMKTRSPQHYMNVNERIFQGTGRVKAGKEAILFDDHLYGVIGRIKAKDIKKNTVKIEIDTEQEERKVHHPFLHENFLKREFSSLSSQVSAQGSKKVPGAEGAEAVKQVMTDIQSKKYYGDREIENLLKLKQGVVNKLTSSFLFAFDEFGKEDRQVIDLGLNLKNWTKKVHVADLVRFIEPHREVSAIYDDFNHDQGKRGSKHVRKHWQFSQQAFDIIKEYVETFPEVMDAIQLTYDKKTAMNSLFDLYPKLKQTGKNEAIQNIRKISNWIESLTISKLPYVEMGFDALDTVLIKRLTEHTDYVKENYDTIKLNVQKVMQIPVCMVYQEMFPMWFAPQRRPNNVSSFKVGNRVMNINSIQRKYIPFGARGTVVGKTEEDIIVLFDEETLHCDTVYGHCAHYRGQKINPAYLENLSKNFALKAKTLGGKIRNFQEKPLQVVPEFKDQMTAQDAEQLSKQNVSLREQHVQQNYKSKYEKMEGSSAEPMSPAIPQQEEEKKSTELDVSAPEWKPKNPYDVAKEREQQQLKKPAKGQGGGKVWKIIDQVEYYLSDKNLGRDKFFREKVEETSEGFVNLSVMMSCNGIKKLNVSDEKFLAEALKKSKKLELNAEMTAVRRFGNKELPKFDPNRGKEEQKAAEKALPQFDLDFSDEEKKDDAIVGYIPAQPKKIESEDKPTSMFPRGLPQLGKQEDEK